MARIDVHRRLFNIYQTLPPSLKRIARKSYDAYMNSDLVGPSYKRDFITRFFDDQAEFESLKQEFERSDIKQIVAEARAEHERRTGHRRFAAVNRYTSPRLYAVVRKLKPDTIVETGVCNGVSTLIILTALEQNGHGSLYSVDYPNHDRIPENEQPGWIIPDDLRERWSLTVGLSQQELPALVDEIGTIDLFVHDTKAAILDEELGIVWPHLADGAAIIADDVHQASVFSELSDQYPVDSGFVAPNVGYLIARS